MVGLECYGDSLIDQSDARVRLKPDQIATIDSSRPFQILFPDVVERRLVLLPRREFAPFFDDWSAARSPLVLIPCSGDQRAAQIIIQKLTEKRQHLPDDVYRGRLRERLRRSRTFFKTIPRTIWRNAERPAQTFIIMSGSHI